MSGRSKVAGGLTVRGTCADGHITQATTDHGRTTWEGTCAEDGCELRVKARTRVAATPPASTSSGETPPPAADEPPATPTPKTPKPKVKQVDYDARPRKRDQRRADPPADDGTGRPAEPPPAEGDDDGAADLRREQRRQRRAAEREPAAAGGRSGIRERITGRRAQEGAPSRPRRQWQHPLDR